MLSKTERVSHNKSAKSIQKENLVTNACYFSEKSNRLVDITHRVAIIECIFIMQYIMKIENLNRVCLQQDALIPLLNLLDFVPCF